MGGRLHGSCGTDRHPTDQAGRTHPGGTLDHQVTTVVTVRLPSAATEEGPVRDDAAISLRMLRRPDGAIGAGEVATAGARSRRAQQRGTREVIQ